MLTLWRVGCQEYVTVISRGRGSLVCLLELHDRELGFCAADPPSRQR